MKDLQTIILAAGKGTRMCSNRPKVLHEVCGKPIIRYVLDIARSAGSLKNYFVLGHKMDEVKDALPEGSIVIEQDKLLGTADAVKRTQGRFQGYKGHILILCGDTPLLSKSVVRELVRKHKKVGASCTFLTTVVHNPKGYGRIIRDNIGAPTAIREESDIEGIERDIAEINVGVYCFKAQDLFKGIKEIEVSKKKKEFYLTDIVELFYNKGLKITTTEIENSEEGLGVNSREDLAVAEAVIRKRILLNMMEHGVTIIDPSTTFIQDNVKIGKDTCIKPFTVIESNVSIGDNCNIGPFARVRSGTKIENNVEIGNFTEISRSKIGSKTIMKHFSFIGDTVIGKDVNVGAGVVTANFDGEKKSATKIADKAFIGSDAILIAPVKVGVGAMIGAGSVVKRGTNVPSNSVFFGNPARRIVKKGKK